MNWAEELDVLRPCKNTDSRQFSSQRLILRQKTWFHHFTPYNSQCHKSMKTIVERNGKEPSHIMKNCIHASVFFASYRIDNLIPMNGWQLFFALSLFCGHEVVKNFTMKIVHNNRMSVPPSKFIKILLNIKIFIASIYLPLKGTNFRLNRYGYNV